jgi:hypothetical protein
MNTLATLELKSPPKMARAPSRSEGEDGSVYGIDARGIPSMIDTIPAGHMPLTEAGCDFLLQFEAALHGKKGAFLTRGRSLLGGNVEPH